MVEALDGGRLQDHVHNKLPQNEEQGLRTVQTYTHTRRSQATEVWLKHWMAVGSRIMFITNCHRMKSRAYAQCKHTHV